MLRFRLLPLILAIAFLVIFLKLSDFFLSNQQPNNSSSANFQAIAAETEEEEDIYVPEEPIYSPNAPKGPETISPDDSSKVERELLESLSKRREELQQWSESISMRENVLNATEMKINRKMAELKNLEEKVSSLLAQYNEKEDAKIRSLVKIYENMKPKDAANIFNELEMEILLEVVDAMSERKVAPILAKVNPEKARSVTEALAKERKLNTMDPAQN